MEVHYDYTPLGMLVYLKTVGRYTCSMHICYHYAVIVTPVHIYMYMYMYVMNL